MENDYRLQENIYAGYAMADFHITPSLKRDRRRPRRADRLRHRGSGFRRLGHAPTRAFPRAGRAWAKCRSRPATSSISRAPHNYTNVLPALVARWDPGRNWLLRGSVITNIGRPDYTDIAPISTVVVSESCRRGQ